MIPKDFAGRNVIFAEHQPEYQPLPALCMLDGEVFTCWEISDDELAVIVKNKCIYFKQLTFNQPLQPILPLADLSDGIELIYQ